MFACIVSETIDAVDFGFYVSSYFKQQQRCEFFTFF